MESILSSNGYSLSKSKCSPSQLSEIRRELTIQPYVERKEYAGSVKPIKVYVETAKRIYMPRFYGLEKFGEPTKNKLPQIENLKKASGDYMKFNPDFPPFDYQQPVIQKIVKHLETKGGGVLSVYCGLSL
jgi:hypothetical protein